MRKKAKCKQSLNTGSMRFKENLAYAYKRRTSDGSYDKHRYYKVFIGDEFELIPGKAFDMYFEKM